VRKPALLASIVCWAAGSGLIAPEPLRAASLDGLAVEVVNRSEPVLCAEKDNVTIAMSSANVRSFRIEAAHPVYAAALRRDSAEADWTACDLSSDPAFKPAAPPRRTTIYEEIDFWIVGYTFETFWRPATAAVRIGDRVLKDLHLIQFWMLKPNGSEEVLVLYPQDGYWRARPFAPQGATFSAYGSSFLIGPIEQAGGRPIVDIAEVAFDPKARTFALRFKRGGSAQLKIVDVDQDKTALDVVFDRAIAGRPFAMLRSMYVTEFNNDVARIAVREKGAKGWREENIMRFDKATATDIWTGRLVPSRHNTSSPDVVFNSFSDTSEPKRPKNEPPPGLAVKQGK